MDENPMTAAPSGTDNGAALLVGLTRLEAKVDVALAQHGADIQNHKTSITDHEARLRVLEAKPTVSPRVLWTVVSSGVALILAAGPVLARLFGAA
ncbi:membrane protein [Arthrobacter phage VroomVroom]|uniref:Membrane protein n=1 Tax=Arthrobacter phage VroomVroom TaxID=3049371 RepID=A0AA49ITJ1_9CAUD|nr:membrane protein [Arthrobacter phage VroomVroom]